jgi:hypothetical protein
MSDDKRPAPSLTTAQKDTARRIGMTEREYADAAAKQIERGKLKKEDIR